MNVILNNREMELFRVAVNLAVELERCCPDVGMGPSRRMVAEKLATKLSFAIDRVDITEVSREGGKEGL